MQIIGTLVSVAALVPFIMVLIKLFQEKGAGHGILGLLCALYTFIWGWQNANRLNIRNLMMIWTGLILVGLVFNVLGAGQLAQLQTTN